jgi:Tfp pilus assembly protein PilP
MNVEQVESIFAGHFEENLVNLRDPFKMPLAEVKAMKKSELESIQLSDLSVVGLITGPSKIKAMLSGPSGKTYFVTEKMKVGTAGGIIYRITGDGVVVREKSVNALGEIEYLDSEIKMATTNSSGT